MKIRTDYSGIDVNVLIDEITDSVQTLDNGLKMSFHPLYQTIWTHEELVPDDKLPVMEGFGKDWLRRYIQHKLDDLQSFAETESWDSFVFSHERPYRVSVLHKLVKDKMLDLKKEGQLLLDIWIDTEMPKQCKREWEELFTHTSTNLLNIYLDYEENQLRKTLSNPVTIYRGVDMKDGEEGALGFSWTLDVIKADWFAKRFSTKKPMVLKATCAKEYLVGPLQGRGESEMLVLNPTDLFHNDILLIEGMS
jgi:hypothetical protein